MCTPPAAASGLVHDVMMCDCLAHGFDHRKELGRLRRSRMWACLVAETVAMDCSSGSSSSSNMDEQRSSGGSRGCGKQLSGYLLMSLSQPLALLPPPFPSTTPLVRARCLFCGMLCAARDSCRQCALFRRHAYVLFQPASHC